MKILCTIILFQPNWDNVKSLLEDMSKSIDYFFLWDNTPGGCGKDVFLGYVISRRGEYGGGNLGLSHAYNEAWKYASENGYDYLMTMDQDSHWVGLDAYISQISSHESITKFNSVYFASTSAGNDIPFTYIYSGGINSGAVIPIRFLNEIGGYNTDFFVDAIDDWLMLEASKHHLLCLLVGNSHIVQKYGEGGYGRFLGRSFKVTNYSPMRLYGIMRNYLILWHDYPLSKETKKKILIDFFLTWFAKIVLGESNKWKKLSAMFAGIFDGMFHRPSRREKYA